MSAYRHRKPARHPSRRAALLVARFEGFRSRPYKDAVGVWTIGYGHTRGVGAHTGPWSRRRALRILRHELDLYAGAVRGLNRELGGALTQPMFDALVSFVYNLGPGAIASSTGVGRELRARHWRRAANHMLEWDKANGRRLPGLTRRRRLERRLFLYGT